MQARQPLAVSLELVQISIRLLLLMSKQALYTFCVRLLWPDSPSPQSWPVQVTDEESKFREATDCASCTGLC